MRKIKQVLAVLLFSVTALFLCSCSHGVMIAHASTISCACSPADSMVAKDPVKVNRGPAPATPVGGYRK